MLNDMRKNDLVSIIMPSYNTAKYISQSIESVVQQSYTNWELIIVDDCSSDGTDDVVNDFLIDDRVKYFKNDKNYGAALSRNLGLREAKGEWIAFLDSDDVWHKNKLKKQLEFMMKNNYFFSYTCYEQIDEKGKMIGKTVGGPRVINKKRMYDYCYPGCLTVMYNASKVGLIQIPDLKKNNDYALWLKIIKHFDCYLINEVLAQYRIRSNSISHASFYKLISSHYKLFKIGEKKSIIVAIILTIRNLFYGFIKKIVYVKKENKK